jgi:hypothetical protein
MGKLHMERLNPALAAAVNKDQNLSKLHFHVIEFR